MEEENMNINILSSKSNNINQNLFLNNHKSVAFNQINSSKIVPNLLSIKNKNESPTENDKESTNLNIKSSRAIKMLTTFSRKNPPVHSYTIKSPNHLLGFFRNNLKDTNINKEESSKLDETINNASPSNRLNHKNVTLLLRNTMTPQSKIQIKRINSINVSEYKNNLLKNNNNANNQKKEVSFNHRNSFSKNMIKNYNFRNLLKQNTTARNSEEEDRTRLYLRTLYVKNYKKKPPKIVNPLQIPEEDKIFDEMKKYLCYKYEKKRLKTYDNKKEKDEKNMTKTKLEFKLKKLKPKLKTSDKIRLNYLYLSTNKISNKIHVIKQRKSKKDLITYQKNLLEVIKPSITDYSYMYLRDRLFNIRKKNEKKYQTNYKRIKEIETEEKDIIYQFNETCENFVRTIKKEKEYLGWANYNVKLPKMNFVSCLQKNKNENDKYQNKKTKKFRIKNLKKSKK